MATSDYQLGERLAHLISREGEQAFESGVVSRRIQAQVQDLLGADTALASPLRDLLLRPAFRQLFSQAGTTQTLGSRDALLSDLAQVYSAAVVARLNDVLHGCLGLPAPTQPSGTAPPPPQSPEPSSWSPPASKYAAPHSYQPPPPSQQAPPPHYQPQPPPAPNPPQVVAINSGNSGCTGALIALLALVAGALFVGMAGVLIASRSPSTPESAPTPTPNPIQPAIPEPTPAPEPTQPTPVTWQPCQSFAIDDGAGAQGGETWWPVVGPADALEATRAHCRGDAFTNTNGNTQVASFRDRDTAVAFAEQLSNDNSHPHRFWVGDPTTR